MIVAREELGDVPGAVEAQAMKTERAGEKRKISGRVIERGRERACPPEKLRIRSHTEVRGMFLHVIESGNHCPEDAQEEPRDFLQRGETELVAGAKFFRRK